MTMVAAPLDLGPEMEEEGLTYQDLGTTSLEEGMEVGMGAQMEGTPEMVS